ncbi:MAG: hypothetical protein EBX18_07425 [Actinobacteria bacterium]|nr:hypothetical protein [Actinomycetota bacterium]
MHVGRPLLSVTGGLEGSVLEALAGVVGPLSLNDIHRRAGNASKSGVRKALLRLESGGTGPLPPAPSVSPGTSFDPAPSSEPSVTPTPSATVSPEVSPSVAPSGSGEISPAP